MHNMVQFYKLPYSVLENKALKVKAKIIFSILLNQYEKSKVNGKKQYFDEKQNRYFCIFSTEKLRKAVGLKEIQNVYKYLRQLKNANLISCEYNGGVIRKIFINKEFDKVYTYIPIFKDIIFDKRVSNRGKILYGMYYHMHILKSRNTQLRQKRKVFVNVDNCLDEILNTLECTEATYIRIRNELKNSGYISVVMKGRKRDIYFNYAYYPPITLFSRDILRVFHRVLRENYLMKSRKNITGSIYFNNRNVRCLLYKRKFNMLALNINSKKKEKPYEFEK